MFLHCFYFMASGLHLMDVLSQQSCEVSSIFILLLQMRKLRPKVFKKLAHIRNPKCIPRSLIEWTIVGAWGRDINWGLNKEKDSISGKEWKEEERDKLNKTHGTIQTWKRIYFKWWVPYCTAHYYGVLLLHAYYYFPVATLLNLFFCSCYRPSLFLLWKLPSYLYQIMCLCVSK